VKSNISSALIRDIPRFENAISDKVFLTIDLDWAHDAIIEDTLNLLIEYNTKATILITHETPLIEEMRKNYNLELGIHPNLEQDISKFDDLTTVTQKRLSDLKLIVPEAITFRSHSTTNSSRIMEVARDHGIQYDLNFFIEFHQEFYFSYWRIWNGMTRVPYIWTDDVYISEPQRESDQTFRSIINWPGIKVLNFHPIHIFLNSRKKSDYENSKKYRENPEILSRLRSPGFGTREKFIHLLSIMS
jgi:hypothetical protein